MKRHAKDFDPSTRVVENCKYMAALGKIQDLEMQINKANQLIRELHETIKSYLGDVQ